MYKGDGTQQEAIERKKMHVGFTSSLALSSRSLQLFSAELEALEKKAAELKAQKCKKVEQEAGGGAEDLEAGGKPEEAKPEEAKQIAEFKPMPAGPGLEVTLDTDVTCCCELQVQTQGSGEETYLLVGREMTSTGCPSWETRANQAHLFPNRLSTFVFGVDAGPDNQGMVKRILKRLSTLPLVLSWVIFCIFHQCHLIVKSLLKTMENLHFPEKYALEKGYFSVLGTVGNTWRSSGAPSLIQSAASDLYGDSTMMKLFKNVPGSLELD